MLLLSGKLGSGSLHPEPPPSLLHCLSLWGRDVVFGAKVTRMAGQGVPFLGQQPPSYRSRGSGKAPSAEQVHSEVGLHPGLTCYSLHLRVGPEDTVLQPAHLTPLLPVPHPRVGSPGPKCSVEPRTCVHSSCSLTLEWNNLGMWEDAFATFCGGVAANSTLRQLDLRNNQISHKGAEELALALKGNTTLQQLGEVS